MGFKVMTPSITETDVGGGPSGRVALSTSLGLTTGTGGSRFLGADWTALNVNATGFTVAIWWKEALRLSSANIFSLVTGSAGAYAATVRMSNYTDNALGRVLDPAEQTTAAVATGGRGGWHLYILWVDPADMKIRLQVDDGTPGESSAISAAIPTITGIRISDPLHTVSGTKTLGYGAVSRAGFWTGVLDASQRAAIYASGEGLLYSELTDSLKLNLRSYWDLTEESGTRSDSKGTYHLQDFNQVGSYHTDNQCSVYPSFISKRELNGPDASPYGRAPASWANLGYPIDANDMLCFGGFSCSRDTSTFPFFVYGWDVTYYFYGASSATLQQWLTGTQVDVLTGASTYPHDPAVLSGPDVNVRFRFDATDQAEETSGGGTFEVIAYGRNVFTDSSFAPYTPPGEDEGIVVYKTRANDAVLPKLTPYIFGDTFLGFSFTVNPQTTASSGQLYLRYKKGINTSTSTYEGQVTVAQGLRGTGNLSFNYTLSGLEADQDYTFWLYMERDTNGLTTTTGTVGTARTQVLGTISFGTGRVTYTTSPTTVRFAWTVPITEIGRSVRVIPASQMELMLKTQFDTYGWDATYTKYTPLYPESALADTSSYRYFRAPSTPTRQELVGNGGITGLTANREYAFRLRVDYKGGAVYPVSGTCRTPDYDASRPEVGTQYSLGVL